MTKMATSTIREWVDVTESKSTQAIEPICIARVAEGDLRGYHPKEVDVCKFRLILDPAKAARAKVDGIKGGWASEFKRVLPLLQFEVRNDPERDDFLHNLGDVSSIDFDEWKIVQWRVFRFKNSKGAVHVFRDEIKWEKKDGTTAFSTYDWKPY